MNVREWIAHATGRLAEAGVDSPRLDAEVLAAHVLLVDRVWLIAHPEADFPELAGESLLQRREAREPLAYLIGWREFYGRRFVVRPGALVPRQETEALVETALGLTPSGTVLDIGTGSGCIAITIKKENPSLQVAAVDVSETALEIAQENADRLDADVEFLVSDLFAALGDRRFDTIVSNPPYIADSEPLMPEVSEHEPKNALFSGPTGLEIYRRIADEAIAHLRPGGSLAMEVGYRQAQAVVDLFQERGWRHERTERDLAGHERIVVLTGPALS